MAAFLIDVSLSSASNSNIFNILRNIEETGMFVVMIERGIGLQDSAKFILLKSFSVGISNGCEQWLQREQ